MMRQATEGFQDVIKRMTEEFDEVSLKIFCNLLLWASRCKLGICRCQFLGLAQSTLGVHSPKHKVE